MVDFEFDALVGATLPGGYLVERHLASGGMGDVFLARDLNLERPVAVKVLRAHFAERDDFLRRFVREAEVTSALTHRNILQVYDAGHHEGLPFFVMEYLEHPTLARLLEGQPGGLAVDEALAITRGMCEGLAHAHGKGFIHRDIKPPNVFVAPGPRAVIADFGLVRILDRSSLTKTGTVVGTGCYLPPEVLDGQPADCRSDVYQVGLVLYEMLLGESVFPKGYLRFSQNDRLADFFKAPSKQRPGVPRWLDAVVERALALDRGDRFATADAMAAALQPPAAGGTVTVAGEDGPGQRRRRPLPPGRTPRGEGPAEAAVPDRRRNTVVSAVAASLLLVAFLAAAAAGLMGGRGPRVLEQRVEAGAAAVRVSLATGEPSRVTLICRQPGRSPVTVDGERPSLRHDLVARGLAAGLPCSVESLVTRPDGSGGPTTTGRQDVVPLPRPALTNLRVLVDGTVLRVTADWPAGAKAGECRVRAQTSSGVVTAAASLRDGRTSLTLDLAPETVGCQVVVEAGTAPWDLAPVVTAPVSLCPGGRGLGRAVGLTTWSAVVKDELFDIPLLPGGIEALVRTGVPRICLTWLPSGSIEALGTSAERLHRAGLAVEVLLFVSRRPRHEESYRSAMTRLAQACKGFVERYHLSTGIDLLGWDDRPDDYAATFDLTRSVIRKTDPTALVVPGTFMMLKPEPFTLTLLRESPQVFTDGALLFHPTVFDMPEWYFPRRFAPSAEAARASGRTGIRWGAFLGMPASVAPVYETGLGVFFMIPRAFTNRGDPALLAPGGDAIDRMGQEERVSLIRMFTPPTAPEAQVARRLLEATLRCLALGATPVFWTPEADICYRFFEEPADLAAHPRLRALGLLAHVLDEADAVEALADPTGLEGWDVTVAGGLVEAFAVRSAAGRALILFPATAGGTCRLTLRPGASAIAETALTPPRQGFYATRLHPPGGGAIDLTIDAPVHLRLLPQMGTLPRGGSL